VPSSIATYRRVSRSPSTCLGIVPAHARITEPDTDRKEQETENQPGAHARTLALAGVHLQGWPEPTLPRYYIKHAAANPSPARIRIHHQTATPLYWARYGPSAESGAPQLVVLHGGPGAHHDYMLPQMLHLAERYDVLFYDQRAEEKSKVDGQRANRMADARRRSRAHRTRIQRRSAVDRRYSVGRIAGTSLHSRVSTRQEHSRAGTARSHRSRTTRPQTVPQGIRGEFSRRQQSPELQRMRAELAASNMRETDPEAYRQRLFELGVADTSRIPKTRGISLPFASPDESSTPSGAALATTIFCRSSIRSAARRSSCTAVTIRFHWSHRQMGRTR
jgi:hypothetical protein